MFLSSLSSLSPSSLKDKPNIFLITNNYSELLYAAM